MVEGSLQILRLLRVSQGRVIYRAERGCVMHGIKRRLSVFNAAALSILY